MCVCVVCVVRWEKCGDEEGEWMSAPVLQEDEAKFFISVLTICFDAVVLRRSYNASSSNL